MKNTLLKFILLLFISTTCSSLFAQGPADPGADPLYTPRLNEKTIIPQDSIPNKKADTLKVVTLRKHLPSNFITRSWAKTEIYYVHSEEKNNKAFEIKRSFFTRNEFKEITDDLNR